MKIKNLWMIAAILTLCGTSMITSCSEDDNALPNNKTSIEQQQFEE